MVLYIISNKRNLDATIFLNKGRMNNLTNLDMVGVCNLMFHVKRQYLYSLYRLYNKSCNFREAEKNTLLRKMRRLEIESSKSPYFTDLRVRLNRSQNY
jgi:hypothetical protein